VTNGSSPKPATNETRGFGDSFVISESSLKYKPTLENRIGGGGFADVYRGSYLNGQPVAIKVMKDKFDDARSKKHFETEMKFWKSIPPHKHSTFDFVPLRFRSD
jgi:serine/threonine protein kinase